VTTWSPQGRLFQVEYAMEAVKQGSACVGIVSSTHAVLVAVKRSPGELAGYQQKVFRIDDHIGIGISGLTADGRSLCKYMRDACLDYKFVYNNVIPSEKVILDVANKHQRATQMSSRRPYGVGLLVISYDDQTGPHLYQTCPSGNYYEWRAHAIGSRSQSARTALEKNFESFSSLSKDELIHKALAALYTTLEGDKELTTDNTVIGIVGKDQKFLLLDGDQVAPYLVNLAGLERGAPVAEEQPEGADETDAPPVNAVPADAMDIS
jgi:20S proteasome subunit alpha 6